MFDSGMGFFSRKSVMISYKPTHIPEFGVSGLLITILILAPIAKVGVTFQL